MHEEDVIEAYKSRMAGHKVQHKPRCFHCRSKAQYLCASPDTLAECTHCGFGVLEVKVRVQ